MSIVKNKYRGSKDYARVYSELITAAKYRGTLTYQEIAKMMGLPLSGVHLPGVTGKILGEISEDEVSNGRPMLSALAVGLKGLPGPGFYNLARKLGKLNLEEDEQQFWQKECQAVYNVWKMELKS